MIPSDTSLPEISSANEPAAFDQAAFSSIYDQYAPILLGVIDAIVQDEAESVGLLETTFIQIRSQFGDFRPDRQPLFVWLLSIARSVALEAKQSPGKRGSSVRQLTVVGNLLEATPIARITRPFSVLNELLDAVLLRNCTPEEAVSSIGLPVATARQQLRLALRQFRLSSAG